MRQPGDIIRFDGSGDFTEGLECIVMEVDPVDGRITKMKAVVRDERLGKMGFILEGEDWVAIEWKWSEN